MKVNFFIDENQSEYVDFHVKKLTPAMQLVVDELQKQDLVLWGYQEKIVTPLKLDDIIRIRTESAEVYAQDMGGVYKVKQRIYQLVELLPDDFIQISSGEIVNFNFIDHLKLSGKGNIVLILNNGDETYVSRRYVSKIKRRLGI
ncbi:LytTR family DNA-binding domain-containing protein [Weissella fangxianensis]|uniref:LytTR family DNA-binding domain-containing protein n=1 Tax=Weissella fangxianensis TaxID=2953879 RepID=UPI0021589A35|nr:LytTR family DNA-binding domain-containing protein [Weissella fangxianensis]